MSCWQDEIHLLGDFFKNNSFVKLELSPRSGKNVLDLSTIFENLLKLYVGDETHIIHLCYAAGWEKISAPSPWE